MDDAFPKRITKWAQVEALKEAGQLTPAELALINGAQEGEPAIIGDTVPTTKTDAVLIRAPLIRYLALGGCEGCVVQADGVQVAGAWIEGQVNLNFAKAKGPLLLVNCHIAEQPMLLQCEIPALLLKDIRLPAGLNLQGAQIVGDLFLDKIVSEGEISLSGASIGGQLSCVGATLRNAGGESLNAEGAQISGGVFCARQCQKAKSAFPARVLVGRCPAKARRCEMRAAIR